MGGLSEKTESPLMIIIVGTTAFLDQEQDRQVKFFPFFPR